MAPHTPQRSARPGGAGARLWTAGLGQRDPLGGELGSVELRGDGEALAAGAAAVGDDLVGGLTVAGGGDDLEVGGAAVRARRGAGCRTHAVLPPRVSATPVPGGGSAAELPARLRQLPGN